MEVRFHHYFMRLLY